MQANYADVVVVCESAKRYSNRLAADVITSQWGEH